MGRPKKRGARMDDSLPAADASPHGIAECLRMLAEEAASLGLACTFAALLETLQVCRAEACAAGPVPATPAEKVDPAALLVH